MLFCDTSITTISRGTEQSREERNLCATTGIDIVLHPNMRMLECIQYEQLKLKTKSWHNIISIGSLKPTNLIFLIEFTKSIIPSESLKLVSDSWKQNLLSQKLFNIDNSLKKNNIFMEYVTRMVDMLKPIHM